MYIYTAYTHTHKYLNRNNLTSTLNIIKLSRKYFTLTDLENKALRKDLLCFISIEKPNANNYTESLMIWKIVSKLVRFQPWVKDSVIKIKLSNSSLNQMGPRWCILNSLEGCCLQEHADIRYFCSQPLPHGGHKGCWTRFPYRGLYIPRVPRSFKKRNTYKGTDNLQKAVDTWSFN